MHTSILRRPKFLVAIALCGLAFVAVPQKAQAFLGLCDSGDGSLIAGALKSVANQTGRKVIVVNKKGAVVDSTFQNPTNFKGHIYVNNPRTGVLYPEIKQTLADGKTRAFSAKGPDGVSFKKSITAVRDSNNRIIGAVIVVTRLK